MTDPVSAERVSDAPVRRHRGGLAWFVALIVLGLLAWRGWHLLQARQLQEQASAEASNQQWQALDARIDALRGDQRAQAQRLQQADATNRVLRDEVLGVGQRAALLEDSVRRLADPAHSGVQALRLDEVELLLGQGEQRLRLDGDLDGARHAYALAAGVLHGIDDPGLLDVRQALAQERGALDALGSDPKVRAAAQLDAFAATLAMPAPDAGADATARPWWQRAFAQLVQVRPARATLADPGARGAAFDGLQLEIALARSAIERRDAAAYRASLARADAWLQRLWPPGPALRGQRARLQALRALPLALQVPTLGSTRQLLQSRQPAG